MEQRFLDRMASIKAEREPLGLNVRWMRADGVHDCMSMSTPERADALRAKLVRQGLVVLN